MAKKKNARTKIEDSVDLPLDRWGCAGQLLEMMITCHKSKLAVFRVLQEHTPSGKYQDAIGHSRKTLEACLCDMEAAFHRLQNQ